MIVLLALSLLASAAATYTPCEKCDGMTCYRRGPDIYAGSQGGNLNPKCRQSYGANAKVAVPQDADQNAAAFDACGQNSFIGLLDIHTENHFKNINTGDLVSVGSSARNGHYVNWQSGQPNNYGGGSGQDIVLFDWDGSWHDYYISYSQHVCCEYPKRVECHGDVCFAKGGKRKPSSATPAGSNLIHACQEIGPEWQLAVPQSSAENNKAHLACGDHTFLGLTDISFEGDFIDMNTNWLVSRGSNAVNGAYVNWGSGQPNNLGSGQHMVEFCGKSWNDIETWVRQYACCEKRTATPTADPTADPTAEPTAEPTPEPTPEPTAEPTPTPTPAELCADGILNADENVCCASECGSCGGCNCSHLGDPNGIGGADYCCPNRIFENDIACVLSTDVGCTLGPQILREPGFCPPQAVP